MAVQARVNFVAQQRLDLNHILAQESFLAYDFRSLLTGFSGLSKPYILRGYEVVGKTGLTISVKVADALVFNPLDNNGSFLLGDPDDAQVLVDLPADQENIFVQARFVNQTAAPVNTAFWDSLALTGEDVAGTEFTASTNTQNIIVVEIEANTVGFDEDAIPIMRASTSASAVTKMIDARQMLFRLGSGGPTPNPLNKFPWSNTRQESIAEGTGVGDDVDSPFRSKDTTGVRNDKGIQSLKEWMDAVMTRISEIAGQALWYDNSSASSATGSLTLNTLFLDTIGHNIQPDPQTTFIWHRVAGDLVLASQGQASVKWQFNYGALAWELGGSFVNNVAGGSRAYSDTKFQSDAPVDNGNIYLLLEREIPKGSGAAVTWASNSADTNLIEPRAVSGVAGDFTGIAIGDYIRKESEGAQRYYRVVKVSDGTTITTTADYICDNTIVAVEVERDIDSGVTAEPLRYWRSKYSNDDLVADQVVDVYPNQDLNFYWLGRRRGDLFILRGYGTMQEGEEVTVLNDAHIGIDARAGDIILEHGYGAIYDATAGYSQAAEGVGSLLTIRRRKRDNTVSTPSSSDNSGASLTYTLASPVGLLAVGETLWVKLSDAAGGALSAGSVSGNTTDDTQNTNTITNVWEILPSDETPLRNYDNRDVYPICRRVSVTAPGGSDTSVLIFLDGTVLSQNGTYVNNRFNTSGITRFYNDDVHLMTRSAQAVLFIDDGVVGRIDEDVAQFFYDKPNQILGLFNYRFGENTLTLDVPADVDWFANLGAHTLDIGSATSTVRIRGDLIVMGETTSITTQTLQTEDKVITLGVGNLVNDSQGSGIQVADNTVETTQATATIGLDYIDLDYSGAHGYVLGQTVGVDSNVDVGGITSGAISGEYTVVATAAAAGDAEVLSATSLRIWTGSTATSTETVVMNPPTESIRTFDLLSWIKMTDSSGTVAGMTSWGFKVKGLTQVVALTPVTNYGTMPTAHSTNMQSGRIPVVGNDNAGPSGADTTFDFSSNLTYDGTNLVVGGNIIPTADNTYDIGTTALRWKTLHVGPGSVVVHGDNTNTLLFRMRYSGTTGIIDTDATSDIQVTTGTQNGMRIDTSGRFAFGAAATSASALMVISTAVAFSVGTTQVGISLAPTFTATTQSNGIIVGGTILGVTVVSHHGILVSNPSLSGGTITNLYGVRVQTLAAGTSNIGIRSEVAAATNNYNLFVDGTARNYLAGNTGIGSATGTAIDSQRLLIGLNTDTTAAGGVLWGDGLSNIYRSAADTLRTDGNFIVAQNLTVLGSFSMTGALNLNYASTKTANYVITTTDCVVPFDTSASGSNVTATLPASTAANKGQMVMIKDVGGSVHLLNKAIVITPNGTDTIDGTNASITMTIQRFSLTFVSNGAGGWTLH